ncbi:MAG TPA: anthrone oxygenase family protein [Streptosporangiaceae bacterium]|nr:anthrone oxygenase family protein [Streptosporangiaceae bacterium]
MIAQLGQAQWFFGNLYEAVVRIPERIAAESGSHLRSERPSLSTLFRPGSPVRYYLPTAPVTLAAAIAAVIAGWDEPQDRKWLGASAASTVSGAMLTAYVVRQINYKLFFAAQPLAAAEQQELLRRWHRLNKLRLTASGVAWLTGQRVAAVSR